MFIARPSEYSYDMHMFKKLYIRNFVVTACVGALALLLPVLVMLNVLSLALPLVIAGSVVILCISAFIGGLFLAQDILKTSSVLQTHLEAIARGDKPQELALKRKDELADLIDSINRVTNRDKAVRQANEDPLTGLANRRYLLRRMEQLVPAGPGAIMFMDLDGFKAINDQHGHEAGDAALVEISNRLKFCVRESDILCRLGGDEFVIYFNGLAEKKVLEDRGQKVLNLVAEPIWWNDKRLKLGVSVGIAINPADSKNAEGLLKYGDEAMYAAKQGGKNMIKFYS